MVYIFDVSFFAGNPIYDFFIGRELNPRVGPLDLKFFFELRPGLIGWVMLDLCFCAQAYKQYDTVPTALLLVTYFHAFYVADALWFEVSTQCDGPHVRSHTYQALRLRQD